jgi:hypothetical protein
MTDDGASATSGFGSVMGSYAVEDFSIDRFKRLDPADINDRVGEFREMTAFETRVEGRRV